MAYFDVSQLAADSHFLGRVSACYAVETNAVRDRVPPPQWAQQHAWEMAAQPGFGDQYASALAQNPPNPEPGKDPGVITDGQILAAVQSLLPEGVPDGGV